MGGPIIGVFTAAASGLYTRTDLFATANGYEQQVVETVRLDVDGHFPQDVVSGRLSSSLYSSSFGSVEWIANRLVETSADTWEGSIIRKDGDKALMPYTSVRVHVPHRFQGVMGWKMTITFFGGAPEVSRVLRFASPYFRTVEVEFDTVETATRVTSIHTAAHPNRPTTLPLEQLSVADVYARAGVDVQQSPNESIVGLEPGEKALLWTDQQLHDAMQMFWSRYKPRAQWALWVLFAHLHVDPKLLGIMFDNPKRRTPVDPIQRQGAAVFGDRIDEGLPAGEAHAGPWLRRQRFYAAVHEIGHCFNLEHSYEKRSGVPWAHDPGDSQALSFMNKPSNVANFFGSFEYRFTDPELTFIRHAPEAFVMMGEAAAGENHGLRAPGVLPDRKLALHVAVERARPVFDFLEPVTLQLTLTNVSDEPQIVGDRVLDEGGNLSVTIQRGRGGVSHWRSYARRCSFAAATVLQPNESLSTSLFASAGLDGWYIAEPGSYTIQAVVRGPAGVVVAPPLTLRVAAPRSREHDFVAHTFLTDRVGRALAFGGTHVMTDAITALHEAADRLRGTAVARHALLTLAQPLMHEGCVLRLPAGDAPMSSAAADGGSIATIAARPDEATQMLHEALLTEDTAAMEAFGLGAYRRHVQSYSVWLAQSGDAAAAGLARDSLAKLCARYKLDPA